MNLTNLLAASWGAFFGGILAKVIIFIDEFVGEKIWPKDATLLFYYEWAAAGYITLLLLLIHYDAKNPCCEFCQSTNLRKFGDRQMCGDCGFWHTG